MASKEGGSVRRPGGGGYETALVSLDLAIVLLEKTIRYIHTAQAKPLDPGSPS